MTVRRIATRSSIVAFAFALLTAGGAGASYHENMISEVHQGPVPGNASGDYIEIQAYTPGQNLVGGHYLITYDGASNEFDKFQFPANVANGGDQRTILVSSDATVPGADFNAVSQGLLNVIENGAACFLDTTTPIVALDCVDWGDSTGTLPSPAGTPVALSGNSLDGSESISRNITRGCATALDKADDTNNSNVDFALATPSPRSNATAPTEVACTPPKAIKKCKKKGKKKGKKGEASPAAKKKKKKCKRKKKKKK